jgi:hypothetical protein
MSLLKCFLCSCVFLLAALLCSFMHKPLSAIAQGCSSYSCPPCYVNLPPLAGGVSSPDGLNRRTLTVFISSMWGTPPNTKLKGATEQAINDWNAAEDTSCPQPQPPQHRKTGYYLVLNQSAGAGQRDIVITKPADDNNQVDCAMNAVKSLSHTRPDTISIKHSAVSNLTDTQLKLLISHELGHSLGLANSGSGCAGSDIMSLGVVSASTCVLSAGTFAITAANVGQSNRNLGLNRDTCTANANQINETPQSPEECGDAGMYWNFSSGTCSSTPPGSDPSNYCGVGNWCNPTNSEIWGCNGSWSCSTCECLWGSPILVDVLGDGFALTDTASGVDFDLSGKGVNRWGWTAPGSDDAFLFLDRNGNGVVDNGTGLCCINRK